jgi:CubicO group peptidase (beta-lactamase class C family)
MALRDFGADFPRALQIYQQGVAAGLHRGAQIYISRAGPTLADAGLGESRPGLPMTATNLLRWLSSGKPITAVAVMQLWESGRLGLDDPVCKYLPGFAQGGKEAITIRHLLTHTAGFRFVAADLDGLSWHQIIARIEAAKLERGWIPGQRAGYHPLTSWFVLGELVRQLDGRAFWQYARDEILLPLGMVDSWIGMPEEQYRAYGDRMAFLENTEKPGGRPPLLATEAAALLGSPGGGALGPARDLGRFYEGLLAILRGRRDGILRGETLKRMTSRQRVGMYDETFRAVLDWGLGFLLDSKRPGVTELPYGYGRHASSGTFGHAGSQSSAAFADPALELVVVVIFNGMPGETRHQDRMRRMLDSIYEDLRLV